MHEPDMLWHAYVRTPGSMLQPWPHPNMAHVRSSMHTALGRDAPHPLSVNTLSASSCSSRLRYCTSWPPAARQEVSALRWVAADVRSR
jgi:hypothetical protein